MSPDDARSRYLTATHMTKTTDLVREIVDSGREIVPADVEVLWSDLLAKRAEIDETMARARTLLDQVNALRIANLGLSSLYHLLLPRMPDERIVDAHDQWLQQVRQLAQNREQSPALPEGGVDRS